MSFFYVGRELDRKYLDRALSLLVYLAQSLAVSRLFSS